MKNEEAVVLDADVADAIVREFYFDGPAFSRREIKRLMEALEPGGRFESGIPVEDMTVRQRQLLLEAALWAASWRAPHGCAPDAALCWAATVVAAVVASTLAPPEWRSPH